MPVDGVGIGAETRLQTPDDCEDLINGSLFLATGGGGDPKSGLRLLQDELAAGLRLAWVAPEVIDDNALTLTPFGMGSVAPLTQATLQQMQAAGLRLDQLDHPDNSMQLAIDELSQHLGLKVGGLVPAEIGGGNVARPLVTGARLGIPVVDGAYADRSVPDEMQTTPYLHGKESWPFVCVDRWGDVVLVKRAANPHMLERIGKPSISSKALTMRSVRQETQRTRSGRPCSLSTARCTTRKTRALGTTRTIRG